jgi:signal transduction histidine kinase
VNARRTKEGLPLALWAGGLVGLGCFATLGAVTVGLHAGGRLDTSAVVTLAIGCVMAIAATAVGAMAGARFARIVRQLRNEAVRRLQDPGASDTSEGRKAVNTSVELLELSRTLDALHLRVRVADEVAARHRRTAETTSAGMFELLSGLVDAEESARGQLSAELHDTVAQTLMMARSMLADTPSDPREIGNIADLVAEAEDQVRAVMARTRPPALRDGDLAQAVLTLRDDLEIRYGLRVAIEWPDSPYPLPLVTAVTLYRFFQESLLNVVKHADVDDARIALQVDEQLVQALVRDEGPGFDPDQVKPERGRHVGLGLLRERVRLAGGVLSVESSPGNGTTLALRMPRAALGAAPTAGSALSANHAAARVIAPPAPRSAEVLGSAAATARTTTAPATRLINRPA